jgi:hypothetical protein
VFKKLGSKKDKRICLVFEILLPTLRQDAWFFKKLIKRQEIFFLFFEKSLPTFLLPLKVCCHCLFGENFGLLFLFVLKKC